MSVAVAERPSRTAEPIREPTPAPPKYPGIPTTCDGAEAVVHVEITDQPGRRGVSHHQFDHDGRRLQRLGDERPDQPVGRSADVLRAGKRTLGSCRLRGLRRRRRPGDQLHLRPGPGPDERGSLHHLRQTPARGDEHRSQGVHQPGPERPRRARRRDERGRLSAGA